MITRSNFSCERYAVIPTGAEREWSGVEGPERNINSQATKTQLSGPSTSCRLWLHFAQDDNVCWVEKCLSVYFKACSLSANIFNSTLHSSHSTLSYLKRPFQYHSTHFKQTEAGDPLGFLRFFISSHSIAYIPNAQKKTAARSRGCMQKLQASFFSCSRQFLQISLSL